MSVQQAPQLVSSFELLVEPITPVNIPPAPSPVSEFSDNGGANGHTNGGTAIAVAPVAAAVAAQQALFISAGPLSRIVRQIAASANAGASVQPIAIQGYFVWMTNLGATDLTPVITVNADPNAIATLTTVSDPNNPLTTASVLGIASVGQGNVFGCLQSVNGVPTLTFPAGTPPVSIPAGGTALFTLVGNYGLISDPTKTPLEVRGSLSIAIDPSSSAQFAPVLLEPQTRTVYVTPGFPSPGETAFAMPTARGSASYTLPGPAFYITSQLNGYVMDAAGPILGNDNNLYAQVVINPLNGSPTQLWYATQDGYIVNAATNYVLDLEAGVTRNGTPVIAHSRNSSVTQNQQWTFQSNGVIQSQLGNFVLDVSSSSTSPYMVVQINSPGNGTNQQWLLTPTLS